MVFQHESETIADMIWFWLDEKAAPTGRLFLCGKLKRECHVGHSSILSNLKSLLKAVGHVISDGQ